MDQHGRIMTFFQVVLSVWTLMHVYVASRVWNLPLAPSPAWHYGVAVAATLLSLSFPMAQLLSRSHGRAAAPLELIGSVWIGILFLTLVCLLAADVVTGFGWLLPAWTRTARVAAIFAAAALSAVALFQGLRAPEVCDYTVEVRGLEKDLDGLRIVQVSDLHVGPFLRDKWLDARIEQVQALHPDLIAVTGDLVDHDAALASPLVPNLRKLKARLGVWGVLGNHEFYAGLPGSVRVFDESGIRLLRDTAVEVAPGLVIAGVDDLSARRMAGLDGQPVDRALANRPTGATIYLSHSPSRVERAAELGADLMLSGHTHSGQIWPFTYLVKLAFPYVAGRFGVNGMTLIVSRGTGFWGPPMRLFRPGEITAITLRAK